MLMGTEFQILAPWYLIDFTYITSVMQQNFYVDDCLLSGSDVETG